MIPLQSDAIRTVLCIGAHADDIEIGCGGTLLKLLSSRDDLDIHWIVLSGNETRANEARSSAEHFLQGARASTVEFKTFRDARFPYAESGAIKDCFHELSSACQPDLIFTHRREDMHQDHRFVSELTWQHFRNHLICEYEIPKYEGDLGQPSMFVPISREIAAQKAELLISAFPSQRDKTWFSTDTFHALLRLRGIECQSPTGLAEAFYCRKVLLD